MSVIMRPPYGAEAGTIQGKAANYTPNADGTYTIPSYSEALALMGAGWKVEEEGSQAEDFVLSALAVAVGQTGGTYGAATAWGPDTGNASMIPLSLDIVFGGTFGSETVTVKFVVTYDDGTTTTIQSDTATGTGTTSYTNAKLRAFFKDNRSITSIAVSAKSTISSSTATVALNAHGRNL